MSIKPSKDGKLSSILILTAVAVVMICLLLVLINDDTEERYDTIINILSIIVSAIFFVRVKSNVCNKETFSGVAWGALNCAFRLASIWFIVPMYFLIKKEISKSKDRDYRKYAKKQMSSFAKTYLSFVVLWIILFVFAFKFGIYGQYGAHERKNKKTSFRGLLGFYCMHCNMLFMALTPADVPS